MSLESPVLRAINQLGGLQAAAEAISPLLDVEVTRQNVRYWLNMDTIPAAYLRSVEALTGIPVTEFLLHEETRLKERKRAAARSN